MSCSENNQTRYLESHKLREFSVFLHVPSLQKKQRNQMIEFPWELCYLVELFLLWYVICASVPKERTRILRWLVLTFSCGESIACAYPNQLCTHETWQKTIWQHAAIFMQFFLHFSVRLLLACFKYNSRSSHSVYPAKSFFNNIFQKYNYFYAQLIFESYVMNTANYSASLGIFMHRWRKTQR